MGRQPLPVVTRSSALTPRLLTLVAVLALAGASACLPVKQAAPPPPPPPPPPLPTQYCAPQTPANASQYQAAFDGLFAANTAGWIASDGGQPIPLPDGRILWMFGDTFVGRLGAGTNGAASLERFASNGFVIQQGRCFRPVTEPIPDLATGRWFWPTGAVVSVSANVLYVFGFHMRETGGAFPFDLVRMEVARFSLPNLAYLGHHALPHTGPTPANPTYGENVMVGGDGLLYLYGQRKNVFVSQHYVARVPLEQVLDGVQWAFWKDDDPAVPEDDSEDWLANQPGEADPVVFNDPTGLPSVNGPAAGFAVVRHPAGGYLGAAFNVDALDNRFVTTWAGLQPQGPFTRRETPAIDIRTVHGMNNAQIAYGGRVVFDVPGGPLVQWSINHNSFDAILANPSLYKVWFKAPNAQAIAPPPPP